MLLRSGEYRLIAQQKLSGFKRYASSAVPDHYEVLGLPPSATQKDIKKRYRELSKKYHPDLNNSLPEATKKSNSESFIKITKSYEVLSDSAAKKQFDQQNVANITRDQELKRKEFHSRYYGSSYSRSPQRSGTASGLNSTRNRVYYAHSGEAPNYRSIFNGEYRDYSINDVPHFDYEKHLKKNINVDKRFSENHGFRNSDYMIHFMRNNFPNTGGSPSARMKNSGNLNKTRTRTASSSTTDTSVYGTRTYQDELNAETNKAPIVLACLTAISLFIFLSGGSEETRNDTVKQQQSLTQTSQYTRSARNIGASRSNGGGSSARYSYNDYPKATSSGGKELPFSEYVK